MSRLPKLTSSTTKLPFIKPSTSVLGASTAARGMNKENTRRKPLTKSESVSDLVKKDNDAMKPPVAGTVAAGRKRVMLPRRSKSHSDLKVPPLVTFNNKRVPALPQKRPGPPINHLNRKISRPTPAAPVVPKKVTVPARPAPYDYKARFNLLKEQHDLLKSTHTDLKDKYTNISGGFEHLDSSNKQLTQELEETKANLEQLEDSSSKTINLLQKDLKNTRKENDQLKEQLTDVKDKLQHSEERLKPLEIENPELRLAVKETTAKLNETQRELSSNLALITELKAKLYKLDLDKRRLHNTIQDLKGNIRVYARIRPSIHSERHKLPCIIRHLDENTMEISKERESIEPTGRPRKNKFDFSFDRVFPQETKQEDVFHELSELVQSAVDGYNVCIFAYGQTGSGKTYTMEGINGDEGMIPRAINLIFDTFQDLARFGWSYTVKAQFLEIYNETIVDLLNTNDTKPHDIKMSDTRGSDLYVSNLTVQSIECAEELIKFVKIAQCNRAVAQTQNNLRSSRSHSVFKITLQGMNPSRDERLNGSLNLIDLAGSERLDMNESQTRTTETKNINKSLSNLSNVILALGQKSNHVPYRDSKLTHLLMPCLGGNSKTLMLVNISPIVDCFNESLNSLKFAARVNQCKTGQVKRNKTVN